MADVVSPAVRSRMMSGIRGKHTRPEMLVRRCLFSAGFRYRLHRKDLPGAPDIVLPKYRAAIFVHGCFWHMHGGCRFAKLPSSNKRFWQQKLAGNRDRDRMNVTLLIQSGWRVLVVWECVTRDGPMVESLPDILASWLHGDSQFSELPESPSGAAAIQF